MEDTSVPKINDDVTDDDKDITETDDNNKEKVDFLYPASWSYILFWIGCILSFVILVYDMGYGGRNLYTLQIAGALGKTVRLFCLLPENIANTAEISVECIFWLLLIKGMKSLKKPFTKLLTTYVTVTWIMGFLFLFINEKDISFQTSSDIAVGGIFFVLGLACLILTIYIGIVFISNYRGQLSILGWINLTTCFLVLLHIFRDDSNRELTMFLAISSFIISLAEFYTFNKLFKYK